MTKNTQGSEWDEETFFAIFNLDKFPKLNDDYVGYLNFKEEALKVISEQRQALLQRVREMLEDEDDNIYDQWGKVGVSSHKVERNKLRAKLRTELAKLEGEI